MRGGSGTFEPIYEYKASKHSRPASPPPSINAKQTCLHGQTQVGALGQHRIEAALYVRNNDRPHCRVDERGGVSEHRGVRGRKSEKGRRT